MLIQLDRCLALFLVWLARIWLYKESYGKKYIEGARLGLTIVKKILDAHKGKVWFGSEQKNTRYIMALYDLTEFLRLSAVINYNLSAASLNRYNILEFILGGKSFHPDSQQDIDKKGIAMDALNYLLEAYTQKRRRLGPVAVLHPLRATAMFSSAMEDISLMAPNACTSSLRT